MSGSPRREDIFAYKDSIMHYRTVVHGGRVIQISVLSSSEPDIKPAAERFLHSFTLHPVP
jgi:hypothetical protein